MRAGNTIELEAGKNLEFETGQDMVLDISEAVTINVDGSDAAINVDSGSMTIQADGAITIEGDGGGDLVFAQNGGGFKIAPNGNITMFGNTVAFEGAVSLKGNVSIDVENPPAVSLPSAIGPTRPIGIGRLTGEGPQQAPNWVDLEYLYADGTGVAGASYTLCDENDAVICEGVLDQRGTAHVQLPEDKTEVSVTFGSDPAQVATLEQTDPQPVAQSSGWYERMSGELQAIWSKPGSAGHTWGTISDKFVEEYSIGQLATNTILTSTPLLDTTQDGRLLTNIYRMLLWDRRYEDSAVWRQYYLALIKQQPETGLLVNRILKRCGNYASADEVFQLHNHFCKGNAVTWLKQLKTTQLETLTTDAATVAHNQIKPITATVQRPKTANS